VNVERETARLVAAHFALGQLAKKLADLLERLVYVPGWNAACGDGRLVNINDLIEVFKAINSVNSPGWVWLRSTLCQRVVKHIAHQGGFPEPETTGDTNELTERDIDVMSFRLLAAPPTTVSVFPLPARRFFGTGICLRPEKVCTCQALRVGNDLLGCSLGDDLATMFPRGGAQVNHPVAVRMVSSSCSTTRTVLPISRGL